MTRKIGSRRESTCSMERKSFKPHPYQQYCIDRVVGEENVGLWLEPGLGKTAVSLMAVSKLKFEMFAVNKVLVIAPKKIAEATWSQEAAKWEEMNEMKKKDTEDGLYCRRKIEEGLKQACGKWYEDFTERYRINIRDENGKILYTQELKEDDFWTE